MELRSQQRANSKPYFQLDRGLHRVMAQYFQKRVPRKLLDRRKNQAEENVATPGSHGVLLRQERKKPVRLQLNLLQACQSAHR